MLQHRCFWPLLAGTLQGMTSTSPQTLVCKGTLVWHDSKNWPFSPSALEFTFFPTKLTRTRRQRPVLVEAISQAGQEFISFTRTSSFQGRWISDKTPPDQDQATAPGPGEPDGEKGEGQGRDPKKGKLFCKWTWAAVYPKPGFTFVPASRAENLSKELEDRFVFNLFPPGQVTGPALGRYISPFHLFLPGQVTGPALVGGVRFTFSPFGEGGGEGGDSGQKIFHRRVKNSPLFSIHSSNNITQLSLSESILDEVFVVVRCLWQKGDEQWWAVFS